MATKVMRRGLSNVEIIDILDSVYRGKMSRDAAISKLNVTPDIFKSIYQKRIDEIKGAESAIFSDAPIPSKTSIKRRGSDEEYDSDIQKIISYKGVIRPLTLQVKNRSGGLYKLRVINIYVKPNYEKEVTDKKTGERKTIKKENTRYYDESIYSVDKKAIMSGKNEDYYYPEKARWSKIRKTPKTGSSEKVEELKETPRKKTKISIIRRLKLKHARKTLKTKPRRTIKKR